MARMRWFGIPLVGFVVAATPCFAATAAHAAPGNDDFRDARTIHVGAHVRGTVTGATKQGGEPRHGRRSGARHSVWYRFQSSRRVSVLLSTCRSNFDTIVAVYSGASLATLRTVDFNNDGCGAEEGGSRVGFTARPGITYAIAVAGFEPRGRFTLRVGKLNTPPNDDFIDAVPLSFGSTVAGTLVHATTELDEPKGLLGDTGSVWFTLTTDRRRRVVVRIPDCEASDDPGVAVYRGPRVGSLVSIAEDLCEVAWTARARVVYRVQVTSGAGLQARFKIRALGG